MVLTHQQQEMLDGVHGAGAQMAMEIQVAIGESFDAPRLVPIQRAHVSLSAQAADIWFATKLLDAGAQCAISPTVNPGYSLDFFHRKKDWLTPEAVETMETCHRVYRALGATLTYSCTPYLFGNIPRYGEAIAFSETSVTVYANSVLGARTNRESAASALCAAITGCVPEYGMLLPENRYATVVVQVDAPMERDFDFSLLGLMGKTIGKGVPVFILPEHAAVTTEGLMALGTQLNVSGSCDLFHIVGVTVDAPDLETALGHRPPQHTITITQEDLQNALKAFSPALRGRPEYVMLGCPHYTYQQLSELVGLLDSRISPVPIFVLTSQAVIALAESTGILDTLIQSGVELIADTCVDEVCCWQNIKNKPGLTDSPKCYYYMSTFGVTPTIASVQSCIEILLGEDVTP